jgi:proton-dependent oligopeptide transporter, POT family
MAQLTADQGHPRGLYLLFFTEMWERFSYYGMRAIFMLFMVKALFMDKAFASNVYGSYTGLVYLTPILGGYLCDRFWGNRRSILIGGLLMAAGQFFMFLSASSITENVQSASAVSLMWTGLTALIIGNGFFKPNISTMVGRLYPKGDHRTDSAFTIFYMGINLGALFSPLICGTLGDTKNIHDYKWGFLVACIGMVVSVAAFQLFKDRHLKAADGGEVGKPVARIDLKTTAGIVGSTLFMFFLLTFQTTFQSSLDISWWFILLSIAVVLAILFSDASLVREEKERIGVIFILSFFVIFFWACFEQAGASLTLFADTRVKRDLPICIPNYLIFTAAAIGTYFLLKGLSWFFLWNKNTRWTVTVVCETALIVLFLLGFIHDFSRPEIPASWFQSINPLGIVLLAPLFTRLWSFLNRNNREPSSPLKMAFGLVLLALGYVVIAWGVHGVDARTKISMGWLITLYILHTMGELSLSPIGLSMVAKLSPVRFSSLLMGTWFLSTAVANKFAGTLSALIPPDAGEARAAIAAKIPTFLGIEITSLFVFFCLFIALSGGAAIALFLSSGRMKKWMHGVH